LTVLPAIEIVPDVGASSPAIKRNAVVFPDPEGPTTAKHSFSSIPTFTSDKARMTLPPGPLKTFVTPSRSTRGTTYSSKTQTDCPDCRSLNPDLLLETEKLAHSWARHEAAWLRDYLVAGVEDPRLNLQSIFSRHFLIRALVEDRLDGLMHHEYRFAAAMDWLLRVAKLAHDSEGRAATLHALRRGADNAEGLEIPPFLLQTFAGLPTQAGAATVPNYIENFLARAELDENQSQSTDRVLDTFIPAWNFALGRQYPVEELPSGRQQAVAAQSLASRTHVNSPLLSLLEPACGSANDYRFLHRFGVARWFDYSGFDLCDKNIENARALFPAARFNSGNIFEISAPDKSFDLCLIHDLFEHLSLAGLEQAVEEVCRVTRQGICVSFFQMDEIPNHLIRPLEDYHWNRLSLARTKSLFATHGFVAQAVHIGAFLLRQIGCPYTHNPNAYTLFFRAS
jgi:SAM-dependent methyltransferase